MCVEATVGFRIEHIEGENYQAAFNLFGYSSLFNKPVEVAQDTV